jgi:hypothetical protein
MEIYTYQSFELYRYNAIIRGKRIEGIEPNSTIKFMEFNELQACAEEVCPSGFTC